MAVKKGFLFTTLAIIIVAVIVVLAAANDRLLPRTHAQADRAQSMQLYLTSLQHDLPSVAYIAGFRSLIGMEEHVSETGLYLDDFDTVFTSMFTNGTANGTYYGIMNESTFNNFSARFAALAAKQGLRANLTVISVRAYHEEPWFITINATIQVELSDAQSTTAFNRTETVTTRVPIESIKDPLYTVGTQGRAPHIIAQSNLSTPYIDSANDTTRFTLLINNTLYVESSTAPSFLQRFTGNFTPSPYGIQSMVSIQELRAQDLPVETCTSIADYLYFQGTDTTPNALIVNTNNADVWLDADSLAVYDIADKTTGVKACT